MLIIEDSIETYELYSEILAAAGYAVIGADNADDGIAKAASARPDLIIMDYDLVGTDGVEATHCLKNDPRTKTIPIVMVTGHVAQQHIERAKSSGCDSFLSKPCSLDELLGEVSSHVAPSDVAAATILYVEDDDDIRQSLTTVLEEEGYRVVAAANGREALDYLAKAEPLPSSIVLDLMMPIMDGWRFRQAQLANPHWAKIPVVILSAVNEVRRGDTALDADAYLSKPVNVPALLTAIDRHI